MKVTENFLQKKKSAKHALYFQVSVLYICHAFLFESHFTHTQKSVTGTSVFGFS